MSGDVLRVETGEGTAHAPITYNPDTVALAEALTANGYEEVAGLSPKGHRYLAPANGRNGLKTANGLVEPEVVVFPESQREIDVLAQQGFVGTLDPATATMRYRSPNAEERAAREVNTRKLHQVRAAEARTRAATALRQEIIVDPDAALETHLLTATAHGRPAYLRTAVPVRGGSSVVWYSREGIPVSDTRDTNGEAEPTALQLPGGADLATLREAVALTLHARAERASGADSGETSIVTINSVNFPVPQSLLASEGAAYVRAMLTAAARDEPPAAAPAPRSTFAGATADPDVIKRLADLDATTPAPETPQALVASPESDLAPVLTAAELSNLLNNPPGDDATAEELREYARGLLAANIDDATREQYRLPLTVALHSAKTRANELTAPPTVLEVAQQAPSSITRENIDTVLGAAPAPDEDSESAWAGYYLELARMPVVGSLEPEDWKRYYNTLREARERGFPRPADHVIVDPVPTALTPGGDRVLPDEPYVEGTDDLHDQLHPDKAGDNERTSRPAEPQRHRLVGPIGNLLLHPYSYWKASRALRLRQDVLQSNFYPSVKDWINNRHGGKDIIDIFEGVGPEETRAVLDQAWEDMSQGERNDISRASLQMAWETMTPEQRRNYRIGDVFAWGGVIVVAAVVGRGLQLLFGSSGHEIADNGGLPTTPDAPDYQGPLPITTPGTPDTGVHLPPPPDLTAPPDQTPPPSTGPTFSIDQLTVGGGQGPYSFLSDLGITVLRDQANLLADPTTLARLEAEHIIYIGADDSIGLNQFGPDGQPLQISKETAEWLVAHNNALVAAR